MADVKMNYEPVEKIAQILEIASNVVRGVTDDTVAATDVIKATAMMGSSGDAAKASYDADLKKRLDTLNKACAALSEDVNSASRALRFGDHSGSQRFAG